MTPDNEQLGRAHARIDSLHEKVNGIETDTIRGLGTIERRQERMQAQAEEQGRVQERILRTAAENSDRQAALQVMHQELVVTVNGVCARLEETNAVAIAAREIAEDVEIGTNPAVKAHQEAVEAARTKKRDWRKYLFGVGGALSIYGLIELVKFMAEKFA